MNERLVLLPIREDGNVSGAPGELSKLATEVVDATLRLYAKVGFEEPWIGYLAVLEDRVVGTCSFKLAPLERRVEIALNTRESLIVAVQTLAERNASHRILEKLEFSHVETIEDPKRGAIWEWRLA